MKRLTQVMPCHPERSEGSAAWAAQGQARFFTSFSTTGRRTLAGYAFVLLVGAILLCLAPACTEFDDLEIVTSSLPDGQVGQAYSARIETKGGYSGLTIRVLSGQLPPGISFTQDDEDAKLDGVPSLAGTYLFTVEARTGHDTLNVKSIVSKGFAILVRE